MNLQKWKEISFVPSCFLVFHKRNNFHFIFSLFQYKLSNMQRCPYIHEMKERLLGEQIPMEPLPKKIPDPPPFMMDPIQQQHQPVATVVKVRICSVHISHFWIFPKAATLLSLLVTIKVFSHTSFLYLFQQNFLLTNK